VRSVFIVISKLIMPVWVTQKDYKIFHLLLKIYLFVWFGKLLIELLVLRWKPTSDEQQKNRKATEILASDFLLSGLYSHLRQFFKKSFFCFRIKSETGKFVLMNKGVNLNKKYGTRQLFAVTSEKSEAIRTMRLLLIDN